MDGANGQPSNSPSPGLAGTTLNALLASPFPQYLPHRTFAAVLTSLGLSSQLDSVAQLFAMNMEPASTTGGCSHRIHSPTSCSSSLQCAISSDAERKLLRG